MTNKTSRIFETFSKKGVFKKQRLFLEKIGNAKTIKRVRELELKLKPGNIISIKFDEALNKMSPRVVQLIFSNDKDFELFKSFTASYSHLIVEDNKWIMNAAKKEIKKGKNNEKCC